MASVHGETLFTASFSSRSQPKHFTLRTVQANDTFSFGKYDADQGFGAQIAKISQATVFSFFELMAGCEQAQSTQHSKPDLSRAVNPASMARFDDYFNEVYQQPQKRPTN